MNILYTNFHYGDGGGHTTYIEALLDNPLHTQYVACAPGSKLYEKLNEQGYDRLIPIEFPFKVQELPAIWKNARLLKRTIEEHDIDIVHTNGSADNRMMLYIKPFLRRPCKIVFTKHNVFPVKGPISRWRFGSFNDAVIFVGDIIRFLQLEPSPKYHVIPNGIDLEFWQRKHDIATDPARLVLISNAGASRNKGWQYLVQAVAGLEEHEKKRLRIEMLARYREPMKEAEALCDFACLGFHEDARPFLEKADVGFVLSRHEASSFACREMLAMGLPLIISDFPVLVEATDDASRWVTKTGDVASIQAALRNILSRSAEELNAMKKAAIIHARENFTVASMIGKTNEVYEALRTESCP